jgi:hypothetical protein
LCHRVFVVNAPYASFLSRFQGFSLFRFAPRFSALPRFASLPPVKTVVLVFGLCSFLLELGNSSRLAALFSLHEPQPRSSAAPLLRFPPTLPKPASSLPLRAYRVGNPADFQNECATFFSEVVQVFGVPKSVGQIYGLLYASPEPLSFSDIVERLEISKGSASQGLQLLRSLGAIKVADAKRCPLSGALTAGDSAEPGALRLSRNPSHFHLHSGGEAPRRIAYEPELSLRRLVSGVMQERISPLAVAGTDRLGRLRELAESGGGASDFYLDRVKQLETWRRRLRTVLPVLSMLLGPKSRK